MSGGIGAGGIGVGVMGAGVLSVLSVIVMPALSGWVCVLNVLQVGIWDTGGRVLLKLA